MIRSFSVFATLVLLTFLFTPAIGAAPPNIVIIMSDDMGYSDIGCYGGEIQTPTLDRLAAGGLRFTQFYTTARCCPTRAALLTGLYPHQAGIGHMMQDKGHDGYRGDLNRRCVTIAEALKTAGYGTYAVGKWHVTKAATPAGPKDNWPLQRGFDRFYGTITGAGNFFDPGTLTRDNTMISPTADPEYPADDYYYTHAISDHATRFVADHHRASPDKPFFLYVAYTAAHWPMHALEKDIAKYRGKYDGGYEGIRRERLAKLKRLGLLPDAWQPAPLVGKWDEVKDKAWESRCMEVYAAMIDSMDQGIGRLVSQLDKDGRLDNTLILFLQDNGGCAELNGRQATSNVLTRASQPTLPPKGNDFIDVSVIPQQTRDGFPVRQGVGVMPGPRDTYIAYGQAWANVSNTPFREYKHWVHEGGISTPLVAHWPARIKRRGELESQPGHLIDLMATCIEIAGAKYPTRFRDHDIQPMEGRSLATAFDGRAIERDAIYWEHETNRAVRQGDWKLVAKGLNGDWELYDMKSDRTETHNLAAKHPDIVKRLADKWQAWAERANVLPLQPLQPLGPNPAPTKKTNAAKKKGRADSADAKPTRGAVVVTDEAKRVHAASYIFDGHNDLPWTLRTEAGGSFDKADIRQQQPKFNTDIPRLIAGGVGAQFWSVYVPAETAKQKTALQKTLEQIEIVHTMVKRYPETFELALTAADVDRIRQQGKIASLIGVEGGHAIEDSIENLRRLYKLGARYMTLTHSDTLTWADSATDDAKHDGLSPFGEEIVREMNRLGMLVDLSHVSAATMKDAIRISSAPVIFSHSSARAVADHPRNVPDDVLTLVKQNGGVVMVNFYSGFIVPESARRRANLFQVNRDLRKQFPADEDFNKAKKKWELENPIVPGNVHDVVDHIDHIVKIAGVDHVGIGSDYDGVAMLPKQLEDVSTYPVITQELLNRGYTAAQIHKIMSGNVLRVLRAAAK